MFFKIIKFTKGKIVTGPQLPLIRDSLKKSNIMNYSQFFEKTYKENIRKVYWAASNNVFFGI